MIKVDLMLLSVNVSNNKKEFLTFEFRAKWEGIHIINSKLNIPFVRQDK